MKPTRTKTGFRLAVLDGSKALQRLEQASPQNQPSQRMNIKKFLDPWHQRGKKLIDTQKLPKQNPIVAIVHDLCDAVSRQTADELVGENLQIACGQGCDACCWYTEIASTGLELEEILHFIQQHMPANIRQKLLEQVRKPLVSSLEYKPCPFLDQEARACAIYPVRPMGCRGLLATKRCQLDQPDEDTGLKECVRLTQQAWKRQPLRGGMLLIALEHHRNGKGHFNMNQTNPEILVEFKKIEPEYLEQIFGKSDV
ncbi:MAG: YkgJ family cysteine cluster protein [SAR324 cluster bacterium]|nr:YkgJ family cysteine cluster protein [SAR324 cluster bacterium]